MAFLYGLTNNDERVVFLKNTPNQRLSDYKIAAYLKGFSK